MKKILHCALTAVFLTTLAFDTTSAQQADEAVIRKVDNLEREAVLKGDTASLFNRLWSPAMVVNTPANRVGTVEGTKAGIRAGKLDYSLFERVIEHITFNENIAIVMGQETVKPKGASDNVGKTVTRRFTNVWKNGKDGWQMIARQATIIKVE